MSINPLARAMAAPYQGAFRSREASRMKSLLFVPANSERKLHKALGSGADVIILDLEDSIAPADKATARAAAGAFIRDQRGKAAARLYVRVNDLRSGMTDDDLAATVAAGPHGVMLPKAESGADVQHLSAKLRVHEAENGFGDGSIAILPIAFETPASVFSGGSYQGASARLSGLTWGAEDLSTGIGARTARDDAGALTDPYRLARSVCLLAAAAAGVPAVDTVFANFRDSTGFRADCEAAERDGFTAKMAIHPDQVAVINAVFTPSTDSIAHAQAVLDAFAAAGNAGVVAISGQMYDVPHLKRAKALLARAGVRS
jgi:citrate lyase subunit beta/citryl-CoA lyase